MKENVGVLDGGALDSSCRDSSLVAVAVAVAVADGAMVWVSSDAAVCVGVGIGIAVTVRAGWGLFSSGAASLRLVARGKAMGIKQCD